MLHRKDQEIKREEIQTRRDEKKEKTEKLTV